jgi:8-oxo-dGTP pyrophosphatase MutT (NUDIX family)
VLVVTSQAVAPYTSVVDVMLLLVRDDRVLLARRAGTGYADGWWNLPSGKLEDGEDALAAVIREAAEEVGVRLHRDELRLAVTVHHRNADGGARIGLFFAATGKPDRQGEPYNAEPHKCAEIGWFPLDRLPSNTYSYTATGIDRFRRGEPFALDGWVSETVG